MSDRRKTPKVRPLFAGAGLAARLFDLSRHDLTYLRKKGTIHGVKATQKRWLYRVEDIVRYLESRSDGIVRDKEYWEDLAYIEEHAAEYEAEAQADREEAYDIRHGYKTTEAPQPA